jgi:hypothetical protein
MNKLADVVNVRGHGDGNHDEVNKSCRANAIPLGSLTEKRRRACALQRLADPPFSQTT